MFRKSQLLVLTIVALLVFAACAAPTQQAGQEAEAEAAPTEAPAPEATEASEEEAAEEPAEETASEEASEETAAEEPAEEAAAEEGETVTYAVDTAASTVQWFGSKPVGSSESGVVAISEGQLTFAGSELVEGMMVIDMTSIESTDLSGNMKNMLEDHLKSDEFFGVETYPTATLVLKSAEPTDVENQYTVVADLTIKETTDEITFVTDVVVGDGTIEATAEIVIDRSIYDVRYGSGSFFSNLGDDLISDEMELTVSLVAAG